MVGEYRRQVKLLQQAQAKERAEATRQKALELQSRQDDFEDKLAHANSQLQVSLFFFFFMLLLVVHWLDAGGSCWMQEAASFSHHTAITLLHTASCTTAHQAFNHGVSCK